MTDQSKKAEHRLRLRVFLCHSSADKPAVRNLYRRLLADGFEPWFDTEKLLPGHEWELEIRKAVRAADIVIVCLSKKAINKAGYMQKEIKLALDVSDEQPEGVTFIIPLKLNQCTVSDRLSRWQWVSLFNEDGYEKLVDALKARAARLGIQLVPQTAIKESLPSDEFFRGKRPERRRWERVSLLGANAYAELDPAGNLAPIVDLSYGGLALLMEQAKRVPTLFNARIHVPVLPALRVSLQVANTQPSLGTQSRVGCSFVVASDEHEYSQPLAGT